jgi:predicted amidohydrolase YtcJ
MLSRVVGARTSREVGEESMDKADLILTNASIVDVVRGESRHGSIAVSGERILAVGADDSISRLGGGETEVIDLAGQTVVPGLIDAHVHFAWAGQSLFDLDLTPARCVRDVLDLLGARARSQAPGTLLRGWGLQDNPQGENRLPNRAELDSVAPDHFVRLTRDDGHASVVNTKTLEYLDYPADKPGLEMVGASPTGVLRKQANYETDARVLPLEPPELVEKAVEAASQQALRVGLTTVHALEGFDDIPHEATAQLAEALTRMPVRTVLWYQTTDVRRAEQLQLRRIGGCIMLDGAPGSHTGALFEPYSDKPTTRGELFFSDEAIRAFVLSAHERGMQVALHATSERAIEQCLNTYESVLEACPRADHRMRLEHGYGLPSVAQLERMARLEVILSTQPAFLNPTRLAMYRMRWGDRWRKSHPHATALRCGVRIAGGSDASVTPMNPLSGIWHAVNHPVEDQRVGVREALRWFTINAAYSGFEEKDKGTIEAGKLADLTVLGRNILTENALTIREIPVVMTIVGGQVRFSDGAGKADPPRAG